MGYNHTPVLGEAVSDAVSKAAMPAEGGCRCDGSPSSGLTPLLACLSVLPYAQGRQSLLPSLGSLPAHGTGWTTGDTSPQQVQTAGTPASRVTQQ